MRRSGWIALCLLALGCDDGGGEQTPDVFVPERPERPTSEWTHGVVEAGGVGDLPSLAARGDQVGVAYFVTQPSNDGACDELGVPEVPDKQRWAIRYATWDGSNWTPEAVAAPIYVGLPPGLDLGFAPDGTAHIAVMTGEPVAQIRYCGANDVGLFTRDGPGAWQLQTAVATSSEAATGEAASDYGDVVGYWPALAFDGGGQPAIAYKDVHGGSLQMDDLTRADLEFVQRVGGWQAEAVDFGGGAGEYNALIFDAAGRPVILYGNVVEAAQDPQRGVWAARREAGGDWVRVKLPGSGPAPGGSLALDGETLVAAWYHTGEGRPYVARLTQPDAFADLGSWQIEALGDNRFDEGYHPSLAVSASGVLGLAYYRCSRAVEPLGRCDPPADAVVFAQYRSGEWETEVLDVGDGSQCGRAPGLVFVGDQPIITYQCNRPQGDTFVPQLDYAMRSPLR